MILILILLLTFLTLLTLCTGRRQMPKPPRDLQSVIRTPRSACSKPWIMRRPRPLSDKASVRPDDPLRLDVAAALAYPDGSMTASGLRKEAARGRLVIERTAGKDYTTLANIERMRGLCRVEEKARDFGCETPNMTAPENSHTPPHGSSKTAVTARAHAVALTIVEELKGRSSTTSPASTSPLPPAASACPLQSR
jgi:hypothetical protein